MDEDPLVAGMLKISRLNSPRNHDLLFTILYNFIPAFIFAPYLFYIGLRYDLALVLLMGVMLFLVDLAHFIRAIIRLRHQRSKNI